MARRHGKDGRLYVSRTSGGSAEPIAYLNQWSFDRATDRVEVTAFGDANKVYVAGLADAQGTFSGFWDSSGDSDLYEAASDGVARKFYLYPSSSQDSGYYFSGEALFDFSIAGGVGDAVTVSGSWAATTDIERTTS
jgi:hypothetical protein